MEKKTLINYIYILCCELAEKNIPFGKGKELMTKALNNDLSFLEIIPDEVSESFTELHIHIQDELHKITDNDKKIIVENLLKETYLMLDYNDKGYNSSLTFRERDLARYNSTIKSVTIWVLLAYLGEGRSLKNEFASFKEDYKAYASKHLGVIAKMLDTSDTGDLESEVQNRITAAQGLIEKYQELLITDMELRTAWENDKIISINTFPMTEQEQEMFHLAVV